MLQSQCSHDQFSGVLPLQYLSFFIFKFDKRLEICCNGIRYEMKSIGLSMPRTKMANMRSNLSLSQDESGNFRTAGHTLPYQETQLARKILTPVGVTKG